MKPVCTSANSDGEAATAIERWNVVHLKDAIPLRVMAAHAADAVDYFLLRRLPAGPGSLLCMAAGAMLGDVVDVNLALVKEVCFGRPGAIAREYFRRTRGIEDFIVPVLGMYVRVLSDRVEAAANPRPYQALPYHQDAYAFPYDWTFVNCWTLLYPDRAGEGARGVEFICADVTGVVEREANPTHPTMGWIEASAARTAELRAQHGDWVPEIQLGDVMLFNQFALHRTHPGGSGRPRLAAEIRMIAAEPAVLDAYARNGQPYFAVRAGTISGPTRARIATPAEILAD